MSDISSKITRPTFVEIDVSCVEHNFNQIKTHLNGQKILCVVKGNAYGHGAVEMSRIFQDLGADYLGVAIPEEGIELRRAGITLPILVLSAVLESQIPICITNHLTITVPSEQKLLAVDTAAAQMKTVARVHLKIDTGMGRIGVNWSRASCLLHTMNTVKNIHYEGVYTHFARSDEDVDLNNTQIKRFMQVVNMFKKNGYTFDLVHHANSGGILFHQNSYFSMVRAGLILYGLFEGRELPHGFDLIPVLSWKSRVAYFKYVEAGTGLGYGHSFVSEKGERVVTLPLGYADGYQRAMGKAGRVIIGDNFYPIVGRICMDQMMVSLGVSGEAFVGDEVILVGTSQTKSITFADIAVSSDTSIYELLCQISTRVPRVYINKK